MKSVPRNLTLYQNIDHRCVSIFAGTGLTGGGSIESNKSLHLDFNDLNENSNPDANINYLAAYNSSNNQHNKILINNLLNNVTSSSRVGDFYDNSGNQTFTGDIILNIDTTRKNTGEFTLSNNEITVNNSNTYLIIFRVSTDIFSGNNRTTSSAWLEIDSGSGFSEVDGSRGYMYNHGINDGLNTCTVQLIQDITSGYKFRVKVTRETGTSTVGTIVDGSGITFTALSLNGADGPTGASGVTGPAGFPGSVYGSHYHYAESNTESSTTSTTYQVKTTFTTESLPLGEYRIDYSSECGSSSSGIVEVQVDVDGTVIADYTLENDTDWPSLSGFQDINISGVNTVTLSYRANHSSQIAKIRRARISLFRIS